MPVSTRRRIQKDDQKDYKLVYQGNSGVDQELEQIAKPGTVVEDDMTIIHDGKKRRNNQFIFQSVEKGNVKGYFVVDGVRVPHTRTQGHIRVFAKEKTTAPKKTRQTTKSNIFLSTLNHIFY